MEIRSDGPRGPAPASGREPGRYAQVRRGGEPATIRLEPGRVVVGTLLRWLGAGTALMLIDGVRVRARVETPLAVGQSAWLYADVSSDSVSPESVGPNAAGDVVLRVVRAFSRDEAEGAAVWLKALSETGVRASEAQWAALARLPAKLEAFSAHDPTSVAEYARAAAVAVAGRLPVEPEVVRALRAALFGEPLDRRLAGFGEAIEREIVRLERRTAGAPVPSPERAGASPERSGATDSGAEEAVALLRRLAAVLASVNGEAGRPAAARPIGASADAGERLSAAAGGFARDGQTSDGPGPSLARDASDGNAARDAAPVRPPSPPFAGGGDAAADGSGAAPAHARVSVGRPASGREGAADGPAAGTKAESTPDAAGGRPAVSPEDDARAGVFDRFVRLWKRLGLDWEASVFRRFVSEHPHAAEQAAASSADSLKPLLSLVSASDAISPELRQTAQSLLQHLTGQQLLLLGDRQDASVVLTMQMPFVLPDGETSTATVYVRSRAAGRRIDPENCWLRFDLRLDKLGETVVDVVVSDRTVSLLVLNDVPDLAAWLEAARPSLEEALRGAGYRLAGVRWRPLSAEKPSESEAGLRAVRHYVLTSQGVDIRI